MTRTRLPNRRPSELLDFRHDGHNYCAGVSRYENGAPAEIFLSTGRPGTSLEALARDVAIVASLARQHGCSVECLRHALTRDDEGLASGPLGKLLDRIGGV